MRPKFFILAGFGENVRVNDASGFIVQLARVFPVKFKLGSLLSPINAIASST